MLRMQESEQGFTLIEIMVTILILGIITAISVGAFNRQRAQGTELELKSALTDAQSTLEERRLTGEANGSGRGQYPAVNEASVLAINSEVGANGISMEYALEDVSAQGYCLVMTKASKTMSIDEDTRTPAENVCSV